MKKTLYSIVLLVQLLFMQFAHGQDSITLRVNDSIETPIVSKTAGDNDYRFKPKQLIIPGAFIAYGVLSMTVGPLKTLNHSTAKEVAEDNPQKTLWDNYTQFAPAVMVYGANWLGLKGKHNFKDRTIILATSFIITAGFVESTKHIVREERPDRSDNYSFPSGHAGTAFSMAQFQFMEYKDENIWYALAGYPFAVFTGVYRVINNKHYVGDVVAGAGFGILSTQAAYWLFPSINKLFSKQKNKSGNVMISPFYQNKSVGLGLVKVF